MSLYEELVEAGNYQSDLHFPDTIQSRQILEKYRETATIVSFRHSETGECGYCACFMYLPFWEKRNKVMQ